jgi:hypothetical protein
VSLGGALQIADTVLFEGYMLYPYRANDAKNRVRWQFGVLAPPAFAAADPSERDFLQSDCLLEGHEIALTVHARFLQVQRRTVEAADDAGFRPVDSLDVGDATFLPWDEAVVHDEAVRIRLPGSGGHVETAAINVPGGSEIEPLVDGGRPVGRLLRRRLALEAMLSVEAITVPSPYGVRRLRLRLQNRTEWTSPRSGEPDRPDALRHALVAAHLLVEMEGGAFVSLIDTPEWAKAYAQDCEQVGTFPVLAGSPGDRSIVMASPIILYDHPEVAPESVAQFCDATEMDEMLTLRTLTLTDEEKRQVRGSDARGAAIVDQLDDLPPELMDRLHGAIRSMTNVVRRVEPAPEPPPWWDQVTDASFDPQTDVVLVDGAPVGRGTAVRLRPGAHRADAQDMFLDGRTATVEAVLFDVDGASHLAVTLDDLAPDEVEPVGAGSH